MPCMPSRSHMIVLQYSPQMRTNVARQSISELNVQLELTGWDLCSVKISRAVVTLGNTNA
jgi:hypothetical protein